MSQQRLKALDRSTVSLEMELPSGNKLFTGVASYRNDVDMGPILGIAIADEEGDFEILLRESDWNGTIKEGGPVGCQYHICLTKDCACS